MVEEILDVDDDVVPLKQEFSNESAENIIKNDPLEELAQVAATQQNVLVVDHQQFYHQQQQHDSSSCYPEDECDDNYLIPYDPAEEPYYHFKPPKWKCMECKQVLRGDVSYDGHMNIHKQLRPYKCADCHREFRCRKALRDHKKIRHVKTPTIIEKPQYQEVGEETNYESNSFQCTDCGEECQSREECLLHYLLVHDNRSNVKTCPFCPNDKVDNLIEHLQLVHVVVSNPKPVNCEELLTPASTLWHCDNCTETFTSAKDLDYHRKMCGISIEEDDEAITIDNGAEQFLESVDAIVYCRVCKKKLLKKNLKRHMTLHDRNKDKNSVDGNTRFLCSYCRKYRIHLNH